MAEIEKTEFEFPDEKEDNPRKGGRVVTPEPEEKAAAEEEIEIVDDTPEEDRGRTPMENPPEDPTDEELATYSKREKTKTREFHKAYHDERRAKEAALREKEEAIRIAQAILEENNRLKGTVNQSQNALLEQAKRTVAQELEDAKKKFKLAHENGDSDALVAAQEEITAAKIKAEKVNNFKPKPLQNEKIAVKPQPSPQVNVDPKAEEWKRANPWFGSDTEMTGFALAVHDKLVSEEGLNPQSDEYYQRIDGRLRQVFPEKFASGKPADANRRPNANVVASASRSVAPKKITLTESEVRIAKRLNIPLERYAREVAVLRRNNNV